MRIDHRGAHVRVPQKLLNSPNVITIFEQVRSEGIAKPQRPGRVGSSEIVRARMNKGTQNKSSALGMRPAIENKGEKIQAIRRIASPAKGRQARRVVANNNRIGGICQVKIAFMG